MSSLVTIHLGSRQPKRYCHDHEKPKFPTELSLEEVRDLMYPKNADGVREGYGWEGDEDELGKLRSIWEAQDFLHEDQPGMKKCRIKIRLSPDSSMEQSVAEISRAWSRLDHKGEPAWVAATDPFWAQMISRMYGGIAIRAFEPAEGDE